MYRRPRLVRSLVTLLPLLAAGSLIFLPAATRGGDPAQAVELILRGGGPDEDAAASLLSPSAAFELRAPMPLVAADRVGQPAADSPLVLTPALPGTFRWTSQRGGVFTPSEPPPLGTTYKAALRPDLKDAAGEPVRADFRQTFHTPPLEVRGTVVGGMSDTAPGPKLQLLFNAAIEPDHLAKALSFRNPAGGAPVPAVVAVPTEKDINPFGRRAAQLTWKERFEAAHELPSLNPPAPRATALNRVVVTPAAPLPPGKDWKLVAAAGLPAAEPGVALPAAVEIPAGNIEPFEFKGVQAINGPADARRLAVRFSRSLDKEVTAQTIGRWVHVTPEPENMKFHVRTSESYVPFNSVEITGDFEGDEEYEITVGAGLPSLGKFYTLAAEARSTAHFVDETPQIAFPSFTVEQLGAGRREFALNARNAAEVRLRAKLVPADQAVQAQLAFDKSNYSHEDYGYTSGHRLDFDRFPGKIVYDKKIAGSTAKDKPATVPLQWDDILGAHHNGMVLLEAEQPRPSPGQMKRAGAQVLVQVTNLGVVWKTSRDGELLTYVFSMADAAPVKASVRLLDAEGRPLAGKRGAGATTLADGLAWVPPGTGKAAWLEVTAGDDCHVLPYGNDRADSLSLYRFHLPASASPPEDDGPADGNDDGNTGNAKAAGPKPPQREVLLFTERGVYKPGEEAHLKAIVREWRGDGLANVQAGTPATLRAFDAKGRRFWEKDVHFSAAGSLAETIPLPKSGLGRYRVEIAFDGKKAAEDTGMDYVDDSQTDDPDDDDSDDATPNVCRFQVQEYQPNAFLVKLAKPANSPVGAGPVPLTLSARYYMGKTLSHAKAVWSLKAVDSPFEPDGFDDYVFGSNELDGRFNQQRGELALDGQGALSDRGELPFAPLIVLNTESPGPRRVGMQASVTDQDQQTVAARTAFTVHSSDFYLGLRKMPDVVRAGEPLPLEVIAVSDDGQPCGEPVKIAAKLSRIEWRTNRVANDSGQSDYDSHPHLVPAGSVDLRTTGVRRVGTSWQPEAEAASLLAAMGQKPAAPDAAPPAATAVAPGSARSLVPAEPGEYVVVVTAQDAAGRAVRSATTFSVLGDKEAEWGLRNAWQVPLVPDRAEYHPGEKATILVKTPISGRALVTVEREGVSRAFVAEIAKEHPAVQVPILPGDAPNVYVSVLLLRGVEQSPRRIKEPEYRAGYCQLLVPKADTRLAVEVHPEKAEYQPGDEAAVQVTVTDEAHRPAAGAEVTLYAVDKGVLSLTGYQMPDLLKTFYHPRPLDVLTGLTLPDLLSEDPADLDFDGEKGYAANKGYLVGGGGEEGRGDRLRQNFVACAYWNATLVTDAEGRVSARFPTPDSLTEYAVMAVVHEGGRANDGPAPGRFGTGQGVFRVNKPLMLEPALPRFGNVGDHLFLRAVVHNQSPTPGEAEVTLDLDDKAAFDGANGSQAGRTRRLHLAPGESKTVDIPVVFTHTGEASWTWHARMAGTGPDAPAYRDTVRSTLPVDHPTPRRSEVAHLRVDDGHADDLLARVNPELLEGEDGIIRVSVSTSRLGEIGEGVDALLHYPYGCVEQTTSSLLPWLALKDFSDAFPDLRHTPRERDDAVARGVDRLVGMQTDGGGLAYWPDVTGRSPSPWGSAYGGLGLALAKQAGYYVPPASFNKLCQYLSERLRSDQAAEHDTYHEHSETDRCLALYALAVAGKGEPAYYEKFYAQRDTLSPEDRTLVALAIAQDKGSADMIRALLQPGPRDRERPDAWNEFASASVLDGMRLLAWCRFQPQDPAVESKVDRLLDGRTGADGTWQTTQGNAWAVLAMAAYARDVEKPVPNASGTVALGERSQPFQLKDRTAAAVCEFPLDAGTAAGKEKLALTGGKGGRLYVQTKVESRPRGGDALTAAPTNGKGGYVIRRQYEKLNDDGSRASAGDLKVGDRVLVSLTIEAPDRASYVAVDDPLPAVLEAVNPDFKTSGAGGNAPRGGGSWWVSDYHELRADRAVFFCDTLYAGHFHLQYLARVRAAGTATAPPAKIEEMYHPERYAETAAESVSSQALE